MRELTCEGQRQKAPGAWTLGPGRAPQTCVALQLAALKIHLLLTKAHIYQTACGHFMRPPRGISNVYKHGWSQWELHLTTECRLVN